MAACKITEYTTVDAVRGCLGLTDNEVTDDMVTSQNVDTDLLIDLRGWFPTHATVWAAAFAGAATDDEKYYGALIKMYSQWYCAVRLCEMWLAMPQRISDGKADMRRFAELDLEKLLGMTRARMMKFRKLIQGDVLSEAPVTTSLAALSSPSYNPVTGIET